MSDPKQKTQNYDVAVSRGKMRVKATLTPEGKIHANVEHKMPGQEGWDAWSGLVGVNLLPSLPILKKAYQSLETAKAMINAMKQGMKDK